MGLLGFFQNKTVTIAEGELQTQFASKDGWLKCIHDFDRQRDDIIPTDIDIDVIDTDGKAVPDFGSQFLEATSDENEKQQQIGFIHLLDRLLIPEAINNPFPNPTLQAYQEMVNQLLPDKQPNPLAWAAEQDFTAVRDELLAKELTEEETNLAKNASLFYLSQFDQYFPECEANQVIRGHATALNQLRQALHQGALWTPMHTALEKRATLLGCSLTRSTGTDGYERVEKAHRYRLCLDARNHTGLTISETSEFCGYLNNRDMEMVVSPKRGSLGEALPLFRTSSTSTVTYTDDLGLNHQTVGARTTLLHDTHHRLINIITCHTPTEMAEILLNSMSEDGCAKQTLASAVNAFHASPEQRGELVLAYQAKLAELEASLPQLSLTSTDANLYTTTLKRLNAQISNLDIADSDNQAQIALVELLKTINSRVSSEKEIIKTAEEAPYASYVGLHGEQIVDAASRLSEGEIKLKRTKITVLEACVKFLAGKIDREQFLAVRLENSQWDAGFSSRTNDLVQAAIDIVEQRDELTFELDKAIELKQRELATLRPESAKADLKKQKIAVLGGLRVCYLAHRNNDVEGHPMFGTYQAKLAELDTLKEQNPRWCEGFFGSETQRLDDKTLTETGEYSRTSTPQLPPM